MGPVAGIEGNVPSPEPTSGAPASRRFEALVCDLDGVVTDTASLHRAAWKTTFDELLGRWRAAGRLDAAGAAPFTDDDYRTWVDGRPREAGVASFLASRGVVLPAGSPDDPPGERSAWAVGNAKDAVFADLLRRHGVEVFASTVRFVQVARRAGMGTAVVSSSAHCRQVLERAGLEGLFDVVVDGEVARAGGLPGKPDPATFLEACRRLGVTAARSVLVEDAVVGVEAGRRGGFGLVVGIDRDGTRREELGRWADVVVADLSELDPLDLFGAGQEVGEGRR